jgi:DNA-binding response OmpR family regulator
MRKIDVAAALRAAQTTPRIAVLGGVKDHLDVSWLPLLAELGFNVTCVKSLAEVNRHLREQSIDIVMLDAGFFGQSVVRHLREQSDLGIVVFAGKQDRTEQLGALLQGADSYLIPPLDAELVAVSLHGLWRRLSKPSLARTPATLHAGVRTRDCWHLGAFGWHLVSPEGAWVALSRSERKLLIALLAGNGEVVRRESLIATLTKDPHAFDPHRLHMLVQRLRRKVRDLAGVALPLLTVRGLGYAFVAEVLGAVRSNEPAHSMPAVLDARPSNEKTLLAKSPDA